MFRTTLLNNLLPSIGRGFGFVGSAPLCSNHLKRFVRGTCVAAVTLIAASVPAAADDWPGFHGLSKAGVVEGGKMPASLAEKNVRWKLDLKTRDVGSMAIQNGSVFVLAMDPAKPMIRLICVDLKTGKAKWSRSYAQSKNHLHSRNTLASSTPATDAQYVYIAHSDRAHTWLRCLDHKGNEVWKRDFGAAQSQHGFGTSPAVFGETVLLNFSQQAERLKQGRPGVSQVIAVDRKTGEIKWSTPVTSTRVCYGTPVVHDGMVLFANTGDGVYALSLATGERLWNLPVFGMRCVSTPLVTNGLVIGSSGSGGGGNHLVAVRMPQSPGDVPQEAFRVEKGAPYVPTSVVHDGALFMIGDAGIASCVDLESGKVLWAKRIGGNFGASPVLVGDKILIISLDGQATILRASRKFEKIDEIDLGGPVGATPAYADGRLLIRVGTELRCL